MANVKKIAKIVPDTSVIIEGLLSSWLEKQSIQCKEILVHEAVLAELESQANKNRETGYIGLDEIKNLRELAKKKKIIITHTGNRPNDFEIRRAKSGEIDASIRELARETKATLITADKVQAMVAESKGIDVLLVDVTREEQTLLLEQYFDEQTMSVHLKEKCYPKAKKGRPGHWSYDTVADKQLSRDDLKLMAKNIVESASMRDDGFLELERKGSTIAQIGRYRIVITKPPLADGYEITAVRPVKHLVLEDYQISEKLKERLSDQAEGILIAGAPGMGKSTFIQALAEFYLAQNKVVKTIEAPRDLVLSDDITQYAMSHGTNDELHDILLLSRPDYTLFDEMRNTPDFRLFSDLRLSGVGMVGVVHATNPIDAIQRFIGRLELGVIPHVIDTVIFISEGAVSEVYGVNMEVKVPTGMTEADLARPVVVVHNFETGKLAFEIYSYGEETVVIPIKGQAKTPTRGLAERQLKTELKKYLGDSGSVEMVSDHKCIIYVPDSKRPAIIGRNGSNISEIEKKLGVSIDVRGISEKEAKKQEVKRPIPYNVKIDKKNITFNLGPHYGELVTDIYVDDDFLLQAKSSRKGMLKVNRNNKLGKVLLQGIDEGTVELRQ